jgi:type IV secretion system protein VirB9
MIALIASTLKLAAALMLLQVFPQSEAGDARLQSIEYQSNQVFIIEAVVGYQTTVMLAPDEEVQNIALGDSTNWQVSVNKGGNQLFVKQTGGALPTNMTVTTNVRIYSFQLMALSAPSQNTPYLVRFRYPALVKNPDSGDLQNIVARYRLLGNKTLWPFRIADDGLKTYILWNADQDLPAVYALDKAGNELLVNGMMRSGTYVIDSIAERLIFRIDDRKAEAKRVVEQPTQ